MSEGHECPDCGNSYRTERKLKRHMKTAHGTTPTSGKRKIAYVGVGVVILGLGAWLVMSGGGGAGSKAAALEDLGATDDPMLGNASAPVAVVTFESPACPACRSYHERIWPGIKSDYVDTGKIAYHYAQFPAGYAFDRPGSIAQQCVYRETNASMFFSWTDAEYGRFFKSSAGSVDDDIRSWARSQGVDPQPIISCYRNRATAGAYESDVKNGNDHGVRGTPFFFVVGPDGNIDPGSAGDLRDMIETALSKAGS